MNISEADFTALAEAAMDAQDRGDMATAKVLDKLARKANAALTAARLLPFRRVSGGNNIPVRWQDMPSVIVTT